MKYLGLFCAALVLAGCIKDETLASYGAEGKTWVLKEGIPTGAAPITITFGENGSVFGRAPCNSYSAVQSRPYPWFKLGDTISTRAACEELDREAAYFKALSRMHLSEISGNVLVLSSEDGSEKLVFTASQS